jgi:transposase
LPGVEVLFLDGMHLVHQVRSSYYWGDPKNPRVFPANSSRQRLNILGAYHPRTMQLIHCTDERNCDAVKVIEFFEQVLGQFPDSHSVVLILDNAPYFRARAVRSWLAEHPKLICWFLPTYSPNLNLIERFWRLAKEHLVNSIYYKHYKTFRCNVFRFLNHVDEYKDRLRTLMKENFQILNKNCA